MSTSRIPDRLGADIGLAATCARGLFVWHSLQALVQNDISWEAMESGTLRTALDAAHAVKMSYGSRLCRYGIIEEASGDRYFVLVIHHAIFDGWSMQVIMDTLFRAYKGADVPVLPPYAGFIKYTSELDVEAASAYWRTQLEDAQRASFPPMSTTGESGKSESRTMTTSIAFPRSTQTSITKATILRTAWAMVLARYCETDDICFGTTVSGRHAPVSGLDRMAGPAVATVPVRVRLDKEKPVSAMLEDVQAQASEMVAFEQFGLQNISRVSPAAKEACDFSCLFILQPMQGGSAEDAPVLQAVDTVEHGSSGALEGYFTYPLVVQGQMYEDRVDLVLLYHADKVGEQRLEALAHHFARAVEQLLPQDNRSLGEVSLAGEWDLQQAVAWNGPEVDAVSACVHDLITEQVSRRPDSDAVVSSEGRLTYADLDRLSAALAVHLIELWRRPRHAGADLLREVDVDNRRDAGYSQGGWRVRAYRSVAPGVASAGAGGGSRCTHDAGVTEHGPVLRRPRGEVGTGVAVNFLPAVSTGRGSGRPQRSVACEAV